MKIILSYITKFIQSISFFLLTLSLILLLTIFNESYILELLENNNYYQELYLNTKEEVSNYLEQSGLEENILDNVITKDNIKKTIITTLDNLYTNKEIKIDTSSIEDDLTKRINDYIKTNNIQVENKNSVKTLISKLVSIYKEEISYNNTFEKVRPLFNKIHLLSKIVLVLSIIISIITYLINRYLFKDRNIIVSLFTNGILLIGLVLYIKNIISINDITFYNESISNILKEFINSILTHINLIGLISIIFGVFLSLMSTGFFKALKNNKRLFAGILVIIWMFVIFSFSNQNGVKSTSTSNVVTSAIVNVATNVTNKEYTRTEVKKKIEDSTFYIRKMAHFTEYLILGILVLNYLSTYGKLNKRMLMIALIICYLYAISDEIHQIFIPGRTAKVLDTLIDGSGSLIGLIIYTRYFKRKCRYLSNDN